MDSVGVAVVGGVCAIAGAGLSTLGAWLVAHLNRPAVMRTAEAAAQIAINEGFKVLTKQYSDANDALARDRDDVKAKLDAVVGWLTDLVQHVQSLEMILRRAKIPGVKIPRRPEPHPLALRLVAGTDMPGLAKGKVTGDG